MPQNLLSLELSAEDLTAINAALTDIESRLAGRLVALDNDARRQLEQNPDIVPAALHLEEAQADLRAVDALRPVHARLQRLAERVSDSEMALGSDAMSTALEGYALLKVTGRNKGLEALSAALSQRFARSSPAREPAPAQ